jgi:hypothetical protein
MWIIRYLACLVRGHSYVDVVSNGIHEQRHDQYCLHCGKVGMRSTAAMPGVRPSGKGLT